jgi:hypothetical protein
MHPEPLDVAQAYALLSAATIVIAGLLALVLVIRLDQGAGR